MLIEIAHYCCLPPLTLLILDIVALALARSCHLLLTMPLLIVFCLAFTSNSLSLPLYLFSQDQTCPIFWLPHMADTSTAEASAIRAFGYSSCLPQYSHTCLATTSHGNTLRSLKTSLKKTLGENANLQSPELRFSAWCRPRQQVMPAWPGTSRKQKTGQRPTLQKKCASGRRSWNQ